MGAGPDRRRAAVGSVGNAYDNALGESFFATLECGLLDRRRFPAQAEAPMAIFQHIEDWYTGNRSRHAEPLGVGVGPWTPRG